MKKINHLTPEQIARFPAYVDKWTRIGLSTAPADRPRAEAAIHLMYKDAKLATPKIVWCSSPLAMGLTRAILQDEKFGASVWASVGFEPGTYRVRHQREHTPEGWRRAAD